MLCVEVLSEPDIIICLILCAAINLFIYSYLWVMDIIGYHWLSTIIGFRWLSLIKVGIGYLKWIYIYIIVKTMAWYDLYLKNLVFINDVSPDIYISTYTYQV